MAGFLLDTNVLSEFKRRGAPDPNVTTWLRAIDPDLLWASVLSFGEIRKGIERNGSRQTPQRVGTVVGPRSRPMV